MATIRTLRAQRPGLAPCGHHGSACPLTAAEAIDAGIVDLLPWPFDGQDIAALAANTRDGLTGPEPVTPSAATGEGRLFAFTLPCGRRSISLGPRRVLAAACYIHWRGRVGCRIPCAFDPRVGTGLTRRSCLSPAWPIRRRSWRIGSSASRRTGSRCRRRPDARPARHVGECTARGGTLPRCPRRSPTRVSRRPAVTGWRGTPHREASAS